MKTVLVRYKIREDKIREHEALIHSVFDELRSNAPPGLRYEAFKLEDGVSFVHLAIIDTPDGSNPLPSLASFKRFQSGLPERCVEPPDAENLFSVDGYGLALTV